MDLPDRDEDTLKDDRFKHAKKMAQKILVDAQVTDPPIILNEIIQHIKKRDGLVFFTKPIEMPNNYSGQIVRKGNVVGILYNSKHSVVRQRFTCGHELGHLILEHDLQVHDYKEIIKFESKTPIEREANIFAAELIMPKKVIKAYLQKNQMGNVDDLARVFQVSKEAMWYKLTEDNLIKYLV